MAVFTFAGELADSLWLASSLRKRRGQEEGRKKNYPKEEKRKHKNRKEEKDKRHVATQIVKQKIE